MALIPSDGLTHRIALTLDDRLSVVGRHTDNTDAPNEKGGGDRDQNLAQDDQPPFLLAGKVVGHLHELEIACESGLHLVRSPTDSHTDTNEKRIALFGVGGSNQRPISNQFSGCQHKSCRYGLPLGRFPLGLFRGDRIASVGHLHGRLVVVSFKGSRSGRISAVRPSGRFGRNRLL